jgi:hypothetical protein
MTTDATPASTPTSRPKAGVLRERFDGMKDIALENAMGKGESWAKKVSAGLQGVVLDDIPKLLAALELKIVDVRRICITQEERDEYEAYKVIARNKLAPAPKLEWDSPA